MLGNTILAMVQRALYGGAALLALNLTDTADQVGSLACRPEDLNNNSTPVMTLIFGALFVGLFALWKSLLSLVIALAAAVALLQLGGKIYRRAVMQGGGAQSLRKAMKLEQ